MHHAPNFFCRLAAKRRFAAARADIGRNILDQNMLPVNLEYLAHFFSARLSETANVTLEHAYFLNQDEYLNFHRGRLEKACLNLAATALPAALSSLDLNELTDSSLSKEQVYREAQ